MCQMEDDVFGKLGLNLSTTCLKLFFSLKCLRIVSFIVGDSSASEFCADVAELM
jgi:hypothetical protein